MVGQVWVSEVMTNHALGDKLGVREKWLGQPWEPPYVRHAVPIASPELLATLRKHVEGRTMNREEMPEASAVYSMSHFKRAKDVFFVGGFLAVKGKTAEILSKFDFGQGGGLVPYTIYQADEKTPLPGPFYIVNFGPWKDCLLPESSINIEKIGVHHQTGLTHWSLLYLKDGDVAVSNSALIGADVWMCPGVDSRIFLKDNVVEALRAALSASMFGELRLHRCKVVV